jgi:tRNA threonylcarbamoyladenosine biosynthesis protein TsaB
VIVLGIDTSTSATAVALRLDDGVTHERRDDPAAGGHPGHATRLLAMIEELGVGYDRIERIAVGRGPGTFTGLRVGAATAAGLSRSLGVEQIGVSSLRALALEAATDDRPVLATIDARRGEVFAAIYAHKDGSEPLAPARAIPPSAIGEMIAAGSRAPLAVGDGAVRYRVQLTDAGAEVPPDDSPLHLLRAAAICRLALGDEPAGGPVLPDYLRRPDAELALERAANEVAPA